MADALFTKLREADEAVDPRQDLLWSKDAVAGSKLFSVISRMPKGAMLHTHGIATGPFEDLVEILRKDRRVFVYVGAEDKRASHPGARATIPSGQKDGAPPPVNGEIRYLTNTEAQVATKDSWRSASSFYKHELLSMLRIPKDTPRTKRWDVFQHCWNCVRELSDSIPLWRHDSYFWKMLEKLNDSGVRFVEMKQLVPDGFVLPSEDGEEVYRNVSIDVFMDTFADTVEKFKTEHPEFIGAKIVWSALKLFGADVIKKSLDTTLRLQKKYPDYVAGFDLVGHEDSLSPIRDYYADLEAFREGGGTLLLHAGETLDPKAQQLYDAVELECMRIGHGYALPRHPQLLAKVMEKGIVIECCPVSNQSLGYVEDLRNHPGHLMLNAGIHLTISSDDAAQFGYDDVTFDFTLITKAWGLELSDLKALARNSILGASLPDDEKEDALRAFDNEWDTFIFSLVSEKE